ncbi:hypothetical protein B0T14DRAFT_203438 [Immersiella caudata]|uniref:Uncharacterized protein n=1 Tax=Immersiella caudata TaxID=314043 RepID=A0AA39WPQ2_9PEZI|nr:hypothetical protein B0T14DRAFT_203438 [Immersiella caudata]
MTSHLLEDVPPPPYTETDIYSHSGGSSRSPISPAPIPDHTRHDSGGPDDAATTQSTSSTNGDIIYTPPLTPRSSSFGTEAEADHLTVSSATAYFETRPAPAALQTLPQVVHVVTIPSTLNPNANDVPYPAEFASQRDIRVDDWQSFVNYLLPHHATARNENVIERKLRAEGEGSESVEAQLGQIRSEGGLRRGNVDATVREWNEGFFGPRGVVVQVRVENQEAGMAMPGAWEERFDVNMKDVPGGTEGQPQGQPGRSRFARFNPFGGLSGGGGGDNRGNGNGGFRFGGIAVDGDRVSIGNQFVADKNGVRIGGFVADTNGISMNGQPMFGGGPPVGMRGCHPAFGHQHGGWGGRGFGGGFGGPGFGHAGPPWGRGQFSDWARARGGGFGGPAGFGCGRGRGRGRGRRGCGDDDGLGFGRGRGRHHDGGRNRSRDSSASSTSSSSSSSSESSIGSLPDHDELKDTQLPTVKGYLQQWLNHPDQPVTKETLKEAKQHIKQARNTPAVDPAQSLADQMGSGGTPAALDSKVLRKEIKAMLREFKSLKKQQTRARKQLRRERKQKRREEKREWRNTKREVRRAERELRRNGSHALAFGPAHPAPPMPAMPAMPAMAPMPPMPPIPPVPPFPHFMGGPSPQARGPAGAPWSPMGLGHLFGGWGGQNEGTTQANNGAGPSTTPGAWPGDDHGVDRQHQHSQAKYKAAADLEAQVIAKEVELLKMHEAIALEEEKWRSGHKVNGDHKIQTDVETKTLQLETEIEALARSMAQLRTQADEEYARELAEEERRGAW